MANETEADVKGQRVTVPKMLRGDCELIAATLAREVSAFDNEGYRGGNRDEAKRIERLRLLTVVFAALGGGKDVHAATIYGAISEGF